MNSPGRKQEDMSWTRMNMVVHVGLMVLVQLGINHAKGSYLSFVINGERSGQDCSALEGRQLRHALVWRSLLW
jgi:hypothetical protein